MTNNTESTTTTKATAATPGAQDAPKPATATKVARTSKGAPKGKKGARKTGHHEGGKARREEDRQERAEDRQQEGHEHRQRAARVLQEGNRPRPPAPQGRRDDGRDRQGHRLAEPLDQGLHLRPRRQEDGAGGREHQDGTGRAPLQDRHQVEPPAPSPRRPEPGGFFRSGRRRQDRCG